MGPLPWLAGRLVGPWSTSLTMGPSALLDRGSSWGFEVGTVGPLPLRVRKTVGPPLWLAGPLVGPGRHS